MNRAEASESSSSTSVAPQAAVVEHWVMILVALVALVVVGLLELQHESAKARIDQALSLAKTNAAPEVQDALDHVMACEQQIGATYQGDSTWTTARQVVWTPCVQHADVVLQAHHDAASVNDFHRRLASVERWVQASF